MTIARTNRLILRRVEASDAGFILRLLTDPSYLAAIGDRGVRTLEEARDYCVLVLQRFYMEYGYGLYLVILAPDGSNTPETREQGEQGCAGTPIGLCGLIRREELDGPDLGYAFLPHFWGKGYAEEAARATLSHAQKDLGLRQLWGITKVDNGASIALLDKLGFYPAGDYLDPQNGETLALFQRVL